MFTASGDIGDYDDEKKEKIAEAFAAEAGVNVEAVSVTVEAGSVLITVDILHTTNLIVCMPHINSNDHTSSSNLDLQTQGS